MKRNAVFLRDARREEGKLKDRLRGGRKGGGKKKKEKGKAWLASNIFRPIEGKKTKTSGRGKKKKKKRKKKKWGATQLPYMARATNVKKKKNFEGVC